MEVSAGTGQSADHRGGQRRAPDSPPGAGEGREITEEQARQQLFALGQRMREAIRNNPANEPFLQAIRDSMQQFFDQIRSILSSEQQELWVENPTGRCFGG